jgi:hypothetical protein
MATLARAGSSYNRPQVIFTGSKVFWRTKNSIDVWILNHRTCRTIEIVTYEPTLRVECTRIYLDAAVLKRKIDRGVIEQKLRLAKGEGQQDESAAIDQVVCDAIAHYVLPRIATDEFATGNKFATRWQFQMGDFDGTSQSPLLISRPVQLTPYQTRHNKPTM